MRKKKVKQSILQPGDIILCRVTLRSPIHDKLIAVGEWIMRKKFTRSNYCHVMMVDSDPELVLEAVWPKTHLVKGDWDKREKKYALEVYRVKRATLVQKAKAIHWAHKNLGVWYNVGLLMFGWFPKKHEVICSTYIAKSYAYAGIQLGKNEKLLSPDEVAVSTKLKRIS
jgi:uncharacterized protein YycO